MEIVPAPEEHRRTFIGASLHLADEMEPAEDLAAEQPAESPAVQAPAAAPLGESDAADHEPDHSPDAEEQPAP